MKHLLTLFLTALSFGVTAADIHHEYDPNLRRFITNNKQLPDETYQQQLRKREAWQGFSKQHGTWWVQFNESTAKPHRAFGPAIAMNMQGTPQAAAHYFLNNYLQAYLPAGTDLRFSGAPAWEKYVQPNFTQYYNGLEVLWSRATVKMTPDYRVVMFGLDIYDDIQLSTTPRLSLSDAIASATQLEQVRVSGGSVQSDLKILPLPSYHSNTYHLVYAITVDGIDQEGTPVKYYTLVDAKNGTVLYRQNRVRHFVPADVNITGTGYPTHPYNPTATLQLPYIKVTVGPSTFYADSTGFISLNNAVPLNTTFTLAGPYAQVFTGASGSVSPAYTLPIGPGATTVSFDSVTNSHYVSAYKNTNIVHDFLKTKIPSYTGLDFSLPVRVERTDGTCNAFYDGSAINFYTTAGGCNALSMVNDVVFHEYGHGITNTFWAANGLTFDNGAMGEGYSDVWAISITHDPVLGIGFSDSDPTMFVRNYDFQNGVPRKVYPANIVGEVHSDGEIICGAWWTTALKMGSISAMSTLFANSHFGLANGPDGAEGQVYTDILIDALEADDNDANLGNGTPNISAITEAFTLHGITLLSNADLTHLPVDFAVANSTIDLDVSLSNLQYAWALQGVNADYRVHGSSNWIAAPFTDLGSNNYRLTLPGQPNGTLIEYYVYLIDNYGNKTNVVPAGANASNPNIPYYILIGADQLIVDDFDNSTGNWITGLPGDDAATGRWDQGTPEMTILSSTSFIQPDYQHTPNGQFCYVTGPSAMGFPTQVGLNDVDSGKTTAQSPDFDLSNFRNPFFEYYRWYSNDQGSNPGTDHWQVSISNDGVNYVPVEYTTVADHSWRRFIFPVKEFVTLSQSISLRFVAQDSTPQSLVEALFDDIAIYDESTIGLHEQVPGLQTSIYPNPASASTTVQLLSQKSLAADIVLSDQQGRTVYRTQQQLLPGVNNLIIPVEKVANGIYSVTVDAEGEKSTQRLTVLHR